MFHHVLQLAGYGFLGVGKNFIFNFDPIEFKDPEAGTDDQLLVGLGSNMNSPGFSVEQWLTNRVDVY